MSYSCLPVSGLSHQEIIDIYEPYISTEQKPETYLGYLQRYLTSLTPLEKKLIKDSDNFHTNFNVSHTSLITFKSTKLHAFERAGPSKTVFIVLHGLGGGLSQFEPLLYSLCTEFTSSTVFAVDLPGSGQSPIDPEFDYTTKGIVDMLADLINTRFPNKTIVLIGHSMGTHISIKLSSQIKVQALCLLAPPKVGYQKSSFLQVLKYVPFVFSLFRQRDRIGNIYSDSMRRLFASNDDVYVRLLQFRHNLSVDSGSFLRYLLGWQPVGEDDLGKITAENILIVCGEEDVVTPLAASRELAEKLGGQTLVTVASCGHNLSLEKPQEISTAVVNFLSARL